MAVAAVPLILVSALISLRYQSGSGCIPIDNIVDVCFGKIKMKRLITISLLFIALMLGCVSPAFAADLDHGGKIFSANCAACHLGGNNVVDSAKGLRKEALVSFLSSYEEDHEAAIAAQVTSGKNAMPSFAEKLSREDIVDVAAYVESMANKGWSAS